MFRFVMALALLPFMAVGIDVGDGVRAIPDRSVVRADPAATWVVAESDLLRVANVIAGEAPVHLMGREAAAAVAWTMRNRMADGATLNRVLRAYFGRGEADADDMAVARLVMAVDPGPDPTGGARWVLSLDDVLRYNLRPADQVFVSQYSVVLQVHVYRSNPWRAN